jgi:CubicO group peptidase (beta-lactamase class C family)
LKATPDFPHQISRPHSQVFLQICQGLTRVLSGLGNKDPDGHTIGQGNLSLTAREFASVGQMVLDQGVFGGRHVVSKRWIEESLTPRVDISGVDPYADGYGYFWYAKLHKLSAEEIPVFFASGNGGNKIYIVPSRDLVLAVTSSAYDLGMGNADRRKFCAPY